MRRNCLCRLQLRTNLERDGLLGLASEQRGWSSGEVGNVAQDHVLGGLVPCVERSPLQDGLDLICAALGELHNLIAGKTR